MITRLFVLRTVRTPYHFFKMQNHNRIIKTCCLFKGLLRWIAVVGVLFHLADLKPDCFAQYDQLSPSSKAASSLSKKQIQEEINHYRQRIDRMYKRAEEKTKRIESMLSGDEWDYQWENPPSDAERPPERDWNKMPYESGMEWLQWTFYQGHWGIFNNPALTPEVVMAQDAFGPYHARAIKITFSGEVDEETKLELLRLVTGTRFIVNIQQITTATNKLRELLESMDAQRKLSSQRLLLAI